MTQKRYKGELVKQIPALFPKTAMNKASAALAKKSVEIMQERTTDGYDIYGRRFGNYTSAYAKIKRKITRKKSYLYVTGKLFRSMKARVRSKSQTNRMITLNWDMFISGSKQKLIAEGLQRTTGRNQYSSYSKKSWNFFGLSVRGSRVAKERNELKNTFAKVARRAIESARFK